MTKKLVTILAALLTSLAMSSVSLSAVADEGLTNDLKRPLMNSTNPICATKAAGFNLETLAGPQSVVQSEKPACITELPVNPVQPCDPCEFDGCCKLYGVWPDECCTE